MSGPIRPTLAIASALLLLFPATLTAQRATDAPAATTIQGGQALLQAGDYAAAEEVFAALTEADANDAWSWYLLGYACHAQGKMDAALDAHTRAAGFPQTASGASYNAACVVARQGDVDGAIGWLGKAVAAGFNDRELLATDKDLDPLRNDPRFDDLLPPLYEGSEVFVERPRVIHTFVGEAGNDEFGWVARDMGDLDGDGIRDFAATAPGHRGNGPQSGRVYAYSSKSGELLWTRDGQPGTRLGSSVAGGVDIDGDDVPDVLSGAPGGGGPGHGFVFSGADGATLLELTAGEGADQFGVKMAGIGDLDGDDVPDIIVGAMTADGAAGADTGRVHVFSGASGDELFRVEGDAAGDNMGSCVDGTREGDLRLMAVGAMGAGPRRAGQIMLYRCDASGAELFATIDTDETGANLGQFFVAFMGDVDGDGVPDVYASDWNNAAKGPATGRVFIHSGASGARLRTLTGSVAGEGFGTSQSVCGDVDGDGVADLVVGAWQNANAAPSAGRCYLYSCAEGKLLTTWTSRQAGDTLGFDSIGLGDVDGDGADDFLLTAAWSTVRAGKQGRVFLVAGPQLRD